MSKVRGKNRHPNKQNKRNKLNSRKVSNPENSEDATLEDCFKELNAEDGGK